MIWKVSFSITFSTVKKQIGRRRQQTSSAGWEVSDVVGRGWEEKGGEKRWRKEEGLKREKFGHHNTVSTYERKGFKRSPHECCASVTLQRLQTPTTETRRCLNRGNHLKAAKNENVLFSIQPGSNPRWREEFCCYCMKISKGPEFMLL